MLELENEPEKWRVCLDGSNKLRNYKGKFRGTESMTMSTKKSEISATARQCDRSTEFMLMLGSYIKRRALTKLSQIMRM